MNIGNHMLNILQIGNVTLQRHVRHLRALLVAGMAQGLSVKHAPGGNLWNYVA
jgi:hypothetical protein